MSPFEICEFREIRRVVPGGKFDCIDELVAETITATRSPGADESTIFAADR
jgi:hypothetical protein